MIEPADDNWSPWRIGLISLLSLSLACLLLGLMMFIDERLTWLDGGLMLNQAEFTVSDSEIPPPEEADWTLTDIPDEWSRHPPGSNNVWYRFRMSVDSEPDQLWGIYLPAIRQNASVWLNGELLGDGGPFEHPLARNWNRPLYFSIPKGLIKISENQLLIRVKSRTADDGLIAPVFLAPAEFLYPSYRLKFFFRYTLLQFIIITLIASALLLFTLTRLRPSDRLYAWYGALLTAFVIYCLKYVVVEPPFNDWLWDRFVAIGLLWFPVLSASFIQRFIADIDHRIERLSWMLATAMTGLLLLPEMTFPLYPPRIIDSAALMFGIYPVYRLLRYLIERPRRDTFLLMTSGFLMIVFGIHDWLITHGILSRVNGQLLPYSTPPGLLLFVYILMRRFAHAMNESERLNQHLQQEVARKHQELEHSFQQMKHLERRNAITEERARLMRDMHDGMGGHLVSLLARVQDKRSSNDDIARELHAALDDLRLMIDSMEDIDGDLLALLAMLRDRMEPRLKAAGITLHWKVSDIPPCPGLNPEKALHILRIMQEAITNVLKHAQASEIHIGLHEDHRQDEGHGILISCRDNGKGFSKHKGGSGRGLLNIHRRAQFIGARAGIEQLLEGGTQVWLWLPTTSVRV